MRFIGVEVEQETSAPPRKKKMLDPPLSQAVKASAGWPVLFKVLNANVFVPINCANILYIGLILRCFKIS